MSVAVAVESTTERPTRTVVDRIAFDQPLPGMGELRTFTLVPLDETGFLFALRSTEDPGTRLFVVPPRAYFPEYDPTVVLSATGPEPVLLVVVHPGQDGGGPTANLLAPIVIDPTTGHAVQVVLDGDEWPLRAPLSSASTAA
ncbi:flagellar assembly protein FliW [Cellulomonas bogoriensis]|uniref:Flagellar assembly factor FliW n=1 Tax=Cellulomonas bogoriensis 69B4 = DSM 16987 TaxID=1386082 RepID=A0A0A0BZC7_9CELL|nr:flagellar assembly protein FliW [Cellulomonas bogoriensis]KGM13067.1 flagellar assembly factor FliW [Cellulomonas bogoriensis 69B4 = DSM 16987]